MDKENLNFDKEVKNILNEEVNFVPDNINKAFDEALLKAQYTKKGKNHKKIAGIAAIFLSVGLLGFSVTPYAQNIPVLRNIYETFNRKIYENYDKYASDMNVTKESNGVGITINKVIYDGIDLEIFYTVEGEKVVKTKAETIYITTKNIEVNGEKVSLLGTGIADYKKDDNVYVGSQNYLINSGEMLPTNTKGQIVQVPDEFILTLEIDTIELVEGEKHRIKGNWNFDIPVSNEKLKDGVKEIEINADLSNIQKGLKLDKLILTPINTAILGETVYEGSNVLEYLIIDDKGRALEEKSWSFQLFYNELVDNELVGRNFMNRYKEVYDDSESITIIPNIRVISNYHTYHEENINNIKWEAPEEIKAPLNLDGETKLTTKYGEDYGTITKVEVKDERTFVYYKPTIGNYDNLKMIVEDENELNISYPYDDYYMNKESTTKYVPETGEFIIEFHKPLSEGNYSITYLDNSRNDIYLFNKAITVDLK